MDISSGLNQPVSFYNKNTGNSINTVINDDNQLYGANIFSSESVVKETSKLATSPIRKKRKRLTKISLFWCAKPESNRYGFITRRILSPTHCVFYRLLSVIQ